MTDTFGLYDLYGRSKDAVADCADGHRHGCLEAKHGCVFLGYTMDALLYHKEWQLIGKLSKGGCPHPI